MADKCVGHSRQCTCPECAKLIRHLADEAAKRLANRTHWTHIVTRDYRHGVRVESVTAHDGLTPEEAIASRVQRLRWASPQGGWSRDGMTLHIRSVNPDRDEWITYQAPDAHTEESRTLTLLDEQTA